MKNFDFSKEPGKKRRKIGKADKGKPIVSIITAYFNGGKNFEQTFNCVMNQTFPWFEWIIIDDGSTEQKSIDLLERLGKTDVRIKVYHKKNGGPVSARNYGIKKATTEYILPLDCDDLIEPTYVEYCWWMLQKNPQAAWAYVSSCGFGTEEYLWQRPYDPQTMKQENILVATALIRKSAIEKVNYYQEDVAEKFHEDWHLWLKLIANGEYPVQSINEILFWYRRSDHGRLSTVIGDKESSELSNKAIQKVANQIDRPRQGLIYPKNDYFPWKQPKISEWSRMIVKNRKKKSILFIFPWLEMGGADKFNLDLIAGLDKKIYDVGIITTLIADNEWQQKFRSVVSDIFILPNFCNCEDYAEFVSYYMMSRQVDLVFVSNSYLGYYLLPWIRMNFPRVAIVDYVHMEEWYWRNGGYARVSGALGDITEKTYTCNSGTTGILISEFGRQQDSVETVHIGVDEKYFNEKEVQSGLLNARYGIAEERKKVLFICRLHSQKRPFLMLEVAKKVKEKIPDIAFVVVGDGPEGDALKKRAEEMNLTGTIYFVGPQDDVRPFYKEARVSLVCSLKEGLSLTAYESCAMGVPVISSDVGGQKDLVDDSVGQLIPCNQSEDTDMGLKVFSEQEIEAYVAAIEELVLDDKIWASKSKNARKKVEQAFTINLMVEYFNNELMRLCESEICIQKRENKAQMLKEFESLVSDYYLIESAHEFKEEEATRIWKSWNKSVHSDNTNNSSDNKFMQAYLEIMGMNEEYSVNGEWLLPVAALRQFSDIIIYGAGKVGQSYARQIRRLKDKYLLAMIDKNTKIDSVLPISKISNFKYDCVLIAVANVRQVELIKVDLTNQGVPMEKIIWLKPQRIL